MFAQVGLFFFQAEDGIRDIGVTGVQTCALPILITMTQIFDPPVEYSTRRTGSLIVITGSMFSGKTEEVIRRVRRALYAHRSAQVFKHTIDTRSEDTEIRSHNGVPHRALAVSSSEELLGKVEETTNVVAIEEVQFFDEGIIEVCRDRKSTRLNSSHANISYAVF